jgi:uncharacterized repeat protein (TIGR03803 family)
MLTRDFRPLVKIFPSIKMLGSLETSMKSFMETILCLAIFLSCSYRAAFGQIQEKVIYSFSGSPDGASPVGKLVADSGGNLYGTTSGGGNTLCPGCGTVFQLSPNGDGTYSENLLYTFCQDFDGYQCLDGYDPRAALTFDSVGNLYGTTASGGGDNCPQGGGCGTVFELSPPNAKGSAWTFAQLYQFCQTPGDNTCADGAIPDSTLTFDASGSLYGTTTRGGAAGDGAVFELSPALGGGWTESVIYSFCSQKSGDACPDGSTPTAAVSFDKSGNLYGTTEFGGSRQYYGGGVVYKLTREDGAWAETVLDSFLAGNGPKGGNPLGAVNFDSEGNIYSTTLGGGSSNDGVVFRLNADGYREQFVSLGGASGSAPMAGVLIDQASGDVYGTSSGGQGPSNGTVYRVAGGKQTLIWAFNGTSGNDGAKPEGALIATHGSLFGTTAEGGILNSSCGNNGCGTVFEISK